MDQKLGNNDNIFGRYKLDHGLQPTRLDPISPVFDANSMPAILGFTGVGNARVFWANQDQLLHRNSSHYVAQFQQGSQAAATFNYAQVFNEVQASTTSPVPMARLMPSHRDAITQYQFIDDFSWTHGNHTFKFGENFRRYDISDHNFFFNSPAVYWGYTTNSLQSFAEGQPPVPQESQSVEQCARGLVGVGSLRGQDEWKATRNLKLTLALRG